MRKRKNAATRKGVAAPFNRKDQDYFVVQQSKEEIQRTPVRLQRQPDQLPATLKQLNQWCLTGHDKIPLNAAGYRMDVTNPANYLPFDEAIAALSTVTCAAGVGFILTSSDNIVIVDVDYCIDENGRMNDVAKELLELIPTYAELSQSKTGLHFVFSDNDIPVNFSGKKGVVEVYTSQRYFALTGWKTTDKLADIVTLDGMTKQLLNTYFPISDFTTTGDEDVLEQHSYTPIQSDEQVLQSLQSNQKFQQLYTGNISGYPSQSEADGALMLILAETTALNADQMRRLFSQSALGKRDKWVNRNWYQDYLIAGAIRFAKTKEDNNVNNSSYTTKTPNKWDDWTAFFNATIYSDIKCYAEYATRKTGFNNLDSAQKFFAPGLYILGGVSGTGKTTFAWQLCEQLARNGENIIYVSYEMSRLDLYAKSISRRLREKILAGKIPDANKRSASDIKAGFLNENVKIILQELKETELSIKVYNANEDDTVEKITAGLKNQLSDTSKAPVVIIDYLQIIPHKENNTKQGIDKIITTLKNFQRDTNVTFIIISSISRAFYGKPLTFEALKESGGIEYSADVVWGLQSVQNKIPGSSVREVQLKALKNRIGGEYTIKFDYYPDSDLFVPIIDEKTWNW